MTKQHGTSLIESLLIVVMVGIIVILMANLPNAIALINKSKHLSLAREVAAKQIEDKRTVNYLNLVNGTTSITPAVDFRMSALPNGSGTVVVEDCSLLVCTNAELIKQVTVTINWQDNNKTQTISLKTFIGEGGLNQ